MVMAADNVDARRLHPAGGTDLVLLSEIYPPAVGGSAVLWQNVYTRIRRYSVSIVTDGDTSPGPDGPDQAAQVYRRHFRTRRWGVSSVGALSDHRRTIRALRSVPFHRHTLIHCSRALPEGVSTLLSTIGRRRRYLCWAHGEELTTAALSREFAFLLKKVFGRAAAVFANSENTKRLLQNIGVDEEQIVVVYPGVDTTRFTPSVDTTALRRRYAPQGETLLVTIARLQRRKGHDHAIEALLGDHPPHER
jgi:phosphatidylinositol alpha-1,6-mannosyltransferase